MMLPHASLPQEAGAGTKLYKRLWVHEVLRVFYDRLVDDKDRHWLINQVKLTTSGHLDEKFDSLMSGLLAADGGAQGGEASAERELTHEDLRRCFFGDYMDTNEPEAALRKYAEVADVPRLLSTIEDFLTVSVTG